MILFIAGLVCSAACVTASTFDSGVCILGGRRRRRAADLPRKIGLSSPLTSFEIRGNHVSIAAVRISNWRGIPGTYLLPLPTFGSPLAGGGNAFQVPAVLYVPGLRNKWTPVSSTPKTTIRERLLTPGSAADTKIDMSPYCRYRYPIVVDCNIPPCTNSCVANAAYI